ncbi:bifunctional [glutamine synthetase] adenylyltransferase/[glutamine synthetase]-adenylyl-L-tyrosine phosphorylase [Hyphobacterium indicum]|uniref:bifunctional [glutamine synthetase] adenylyltransferase/[glutamine synthetase]-adenylyl-L-tyrosine phosphorylase n=1 Tax=Hyphobacterium indicum TaxID=2162714 RepID=UPI000D6521F5|nr:bifunctional [glutamine synthetase] adenylyltransferase/[glutamine synthetase]-adenylyl-L-tyrosine phosphorylase [Hyphobacterium indicum]
MAHADTLFSLRAFDGPAADLGERPCRYPDGLPAAEARFLDTVFANSPYLARLARSRAALLAQLAEQDVQTIIGGLTADIDGLARQASGEAALAAGLRQIKGDAHFALGLAEISGAIEVMDAAALLSGFADACIRGGLAGLVRFGAEAGKYDAWTDPANPLPGVFVLALGKLGASELNFSSDIDLVALYDPDHLSGPVAEDPGKRLPRLIKALVRLLEENTPDGYVFRVDLRLRPDPSATPPIMSITAAMNYYESLGQNWERAAYIKARPCAGDQEAAKAFLADMRPFIWRRTLDYAAVEDIHSLARQIQSVGDRARIRPGGHDLKLGRGGIREIEFFAQVPQLVMGGRMPELRLTSPYKVLSALAAADIVDTGSAESLQANYRFLRKVEHRIQMVADEQTQTLPADDSHRTAIAHLAGLGSLAELDSAVVETLQSVHAAFSRQFSHEDSLADECGSLIFTGVEPTKETLETLSALGFQFPDTAWSRMNSWLAGKARALRTNRARQVLTRVAPRLLRAMSDTSEPDSAFTRFAAFIEGLPMGVQPLTMLENEPDLARELVAIIGLAPRMATTLAQRPAVMDVMLDARFSQPLRNDDPDEQARRMAFQMSEARDAEDAMNRGRRLVREERFRIGSQLLVGRADAESAGEAFGRLADIAIHAMADVALEQVTDRYGPPPGEFAVLGLGKLGSHELAADSDLDIMMIYDPADGRESDAPAFFTRLTQRLVSALSSPTEEGSMYETDMQLRPSGKAGPVAVRLSSFGEYYRESAWTWERMALTRARVITGSPGMSDRIAADIEIALTYKLDPRQIVDDALDMRRRMERERRAKGAWDVKRRPGGILDIEFIAQTGQLLLAQQGQYQRCANTAAQITSLESAGLLTAAEAQSLRQTMRLWLNLSQIIRTAHGSGFDPNSASKAFAQRLSGVAEQADIHALGELVETRADEVRRIFEICLGKMQEDATDCAPRFVEWSARPQSGD